MQLDDDGPWTAACFAISDLQFDGTQHGMNDRATLCGIDASLMSLVRNPFYGSGPNDCAACGHELARLGRILVPTARGLERALPASVEQVRAAEATLAAALPSDLHVLYRNSNGAFSTVGQWWLVWPLTQMIDAWRWLSEVPGYGDRWVAFGDDGTGDPYCLHRDDGRVTRLSMVDLSHEEIARDLDGFWTRVARG